MVRRHGWQLPAHTLQVVAITVFCLLVVAYYAFFAPFVGKPILEYLAIAIYSPVAVTVFILYVRCTTINPADPGIMSMFDGSYINVPKSNGGLDSTKMQMKPEYAAGTHSPKSAYQSSVDDHVNQKELSVGDLNTNVSAPQSKGSSWCCLLAAPLCFLFVKEDCRKPDETELSANAANPEEALFCTLCNAEVRKFSKHCRSCDKCVDGFDHHCRWLNNCVGRKNYFTFIALMATSLLWLVIEFGVGVAVLVLSFVNKKATVNSIEDKLGNGFTLAPFATVVAVCTALSLVACIPLGELFFFHIILMKKGITTYEYVVAMRAMNENEAPPASLDEEGGLQIEYSPSNSVTTGFSGGSSLGIPYKGTWCTPPRVFDHQLDEVVPHLQRGMVPSTVDPDSAGYLERVNKPKKPIKLSARKLAKLDPKEAIEAANRARASSSVLRPLDGRRIPDADPSTGDNSSIRSSVSIEYRSTKETMGDAKLSSLENSYPPSIASQEDYETTQSASSLSSPLHLQKKATPVDVVLRAPPAPPRPQPVVTRSATPMTQLTNPMFQSATSYVRESKKASVVWDQDAGRYVSVLATSRPATSINLPSRILPHLTSANPREQNVYATRSREPNVPTSAVPPAGQDRAMHLGQSIFFGGPLLKSSNAGAQRSEPSSSIQRQERSAYAHTSEIRGERNRTDSFPVFTPGSLPRNPPYVTK